MTTFDVLCFLSLLKHREERCCQGGTEREHAKEVTETRQPNSEAFVVPSTGNLKGAMDFGYCNNNPQVFIAALVGYLKLLPPRWNYGRISELLGPLRSSH